MLIITKTLPRSANILSILTYFLPHWGRSCNSHQTGSAPNKLQCQRVNSIRVTYERRHHVATTNPVMPMVSVCVPPLARPYQRICGFMSLTHM